jgi:hypothetical protein
LRLEHGVPAGQWRYWSLHGDAVEGDDGGGVCVQRQGAIVVGRRQLDLLCLPILELGSQLRRHIVILEASDAADGSERERVRGEGGGVDGGERLDVDGCGRSIGGSSSRSSDDGAGRGRSGERCGGL